MAWPGWAPGGAGRTSSGRGVCHTSGNAQAAPYQSRRPGGVPYNCVIMARAMTTGPRPAPGRPQSFDHRAIEPKWQARWEAERLYDAEAEEGSSRPKHYALVMFPYTSGDLHLGHWWNFALADVHTRYKRMQGFNVLFPPGFDAFGLPAEGAAIKSGTHPYTWTMENIRRMERQWRTMGGAYDWSKELATCLPDYYRWNQWLFLQFLKRGLAYRQQAPVNWCPNHGVLANEQVHNGRCWRCGAPVSKRDLEQWFFRITDYADDLLDFSEIDWPERIKAMQTNWIGRSEGVEFDLPVEGHPELKISVFTTRVDARPPEAADDITADELPGNSAYVEPGVMVNSGQFNGLSNEEAWERIADWFEERGVGRRRVNYRMRDWLVSRQRYWGTPIPIVYCPTDGVVPVPEDQLPVLLPEDVEFKASAAAEGNPLASSASFVNTVCPMCGGPARRETDTMDTFMDSSWYFLRYVSPKLEDAPFDVDKVRYWLPVDQYMGGAEHAVMHLLYSRFFVRVLHDLGLVPFKEPITRLYNQGVVLGPDGQRMSKRHGNVVNAGDYVVSARADAVRA